MPNQDGTGPGNTKPGRGKGHCGGKQGEKGGGRGGGRRQGGNRGGGQGRGGGGVRNAETGTPKSSAT